MTQALHPIKYTLPPSATGQTRPSLVPRRQLFDKLSSGLAGKATLVSASAGYGKTTTLIAWAHAQHERLTDIAWVSLDEADNDSQRFFAALIAAVQAATPEIGARAQDLLASDASPPLETLVTLLLDDLAEWSSRLVLILDDYHLISAEIIHHALDHWLANQPPHVHLILAARHEPPLHLSSLRSSSQLSDITPTDLRFSRQETAAFLKVVMGLSLNNEAIDTLETLTGGWAAMLQLSAVALRDRIDIVPTLAQLGGENRVAFETLAGEVVAHQSAEIRTFLHQVSTLDPISAEIPNALPLLQQLAQANLFTTPLDADQQWWRIHSLFRTAIQATNSAETPPND